MNSEGQISQQKTNNKKTVNDYIENSYASSYDRNEVSLLTDPSLPQEPSLGPLEKEEKKDDTRQTGGISVYRYYFSSIDWKIAAVYLIFQLSLAFLSTFPGTFY
jgi:hypothetical protein